MSAAQPPDPDLLSDAARSGTIGFSMMIARRLLSPDKPPFLDVLLQAIAAAGVSVLVGWGASEYIQSQKLLYAVVGVAGFAAPEVAAFAIRYLKAQGEAKLKEVEGKSKSNAQRKGKAKRRD